MAGIRGVVMGDGFPRFSVMGGSVEMVAHIRSLPGPREGVTTRVESLI